MHRVVVRGFQRLEVAGERTRTRRRRADFDSDGRRGGGNAGPRQALYTRQFGGERVRVRLVRAAADPVRVHRHRGEIRAARGWRRDLRRTADSRGRLDRECALTYRARSTTFAVTEGVRGDGRMA